MQCWRQSNAPTFAVVLCTLLGIALLSFVVVAARRFGIVFLSAVARCFAAAFARRFTSAGEELRR